MRTEQTAVDYGSRFETLQSKFIDEPREAVREAGDLVRLAVDRLLEREQNTEDLRRLMQGYRDLLARLEAHDGHAATRRQESSATPGARRGRVTSSELTEGPAPTAEPSQPDR